MNVNPERLKLYSSSERVVATWIDGKPVYERRVSYENTSIIQEGSRYKSEVNLVSDVKNVISVDGTVKNATSADFGIGTTMIDSAGNVVRTIFWYKSATNKLVIAHQETSSFNYSYGSLVVRYTKTTD